MDIIVAGKSYMRLAADGAVHISSDGITLKTEIL